MAAVTTSWIEKATYGSKVFPSYFWQQLSRRMPTGRVHLLFALADHFEPYISSEGGRGQVTHSEQLSRVEWWCRAYPKLIDRWRDEEGRPFIHSYFYPAEHYEIDLIDMLSRHCHAGWGEIEIHHHHGIEQPDTADNTRRALVEFRDALAFRHGCLASLNEHDDIPRYVFAHGNFALANSAGGRFCGVDSELAVLAETGCYADMTLPTAPLHPAQTAKINSIYECSLPLKDVAAHRHGRDVRVLRPPKTFPLIIQGPWAVDFGRSWRSSRLRIENGSITRSNPLSLHRLKLWKKAAVRVVGRPDWLFIKLHAHGMDPLHKESVAGESMRRFLEDLIQGANERKEILHFTSAREMANIILAASDGREGNPGSYRDYKFKRFRTASASRDESRSNATRLS